MMTTMVLPAFSGRLPTLTAACQRGTRRDADRDAFEPRDEAGIFEGLVVRDLHDLVIDRRIEDRRHETGADALDLVRAGIAAGQDRAVGRLDRDDLETGLPGLQHLADAGDRAAGADAGDEDVDLSVVSFQISSAVVWRWISGLAGFSNCWGMIAPGWSAASSSALAIAPFMPFGPSVSTSSAPSSASILRRSSDMVSGMVRMRR
jgi:hypothetical protein